MNTENKRKITGMLADFCKIKGDQTKLADKMRGVSHSTVSNILTGKWDLIADEMWLHVNNQIKNILNKVVVTDLVGFDSMAFFIDEAQKNSLMIALIGNEGSGKTEAFTYASEHNKNTYHIKCADYWNKRFFVSEIIRILKIDTGSKSIPYMMRDVCKAIEKKPIPILIIDEADKLSDTLLYFLISLYNDLKGTCAIVIAGTPFLEKRIMRGVDLNKKGFREIHSRIGRKFLHIPLPNEEDITKLCIAQGIDNVVDIDEIIADSGNDLRRVDRLIFAKKGSEV